MNLKNYKFKFFKKIKDNLENYKKKLFICKLKSINDVEIFNYLCRFHKIEIVDYDFDIITVYTREKKIVKFQNFCDCEKIDFWTISYFKYFG